MSNEQFAQKELPRYQCHKQVWALKIKSIAATDDGGAMLHVHEEDYASIYVPPEYLMKHKPMPGGYFVLYDGGYQSFSPAEAFLSGYSKADGGSYEAHEKLLRAVPDDSIIRYVDAHPELLFELMNSLMPSKKVDKPEGGLQ